MLTNPHALLAKGWK